MILDDVIAHKGERVREQVEERDAKLPLLLTYRGGFRKIKALLRMERTRSRGALVEAMARALDAVMSEDAKSWFAYCG